ncbi:hypothetical protein N9S67_01305 [Candidatus Pelagibacter sp.]|nr:hypothetical protein [Candidatus Pelagibacter sp.]
MKLDFNEILNVKKTSTNNKTVINYNNFKYEKTYLGNQLRKGYYKHYKKKSENFIFNINYEIGDDNFRINSIIKNDDDKLLKASFFGGSDIFGWGLKENETLPYLFYKKNKNYNVFNYGIIGGSINQNLEMIRKNINTLGDINIVVASSYQLPRISCNRDYSFNTPTFKIVNDELKFDGYCIFSFLRLNFQIPRLFGSIINRSEIIKILNKVFTDENNSKNIETYVKIIDEINLISKKNDKKLIVLYYGSKQKVDKKIINFFVKNNISFIDVSLLDKKYFIKYDKHFNKFANEIWLDKLSKYMVTFKH